MHRFIESEIVKEAIPTDNCSYNEVLLDMMVKMSLTVNCPQVDTPAPRESVDLESAVSAVSEISANYNF